MHDSSEAHVITILEKANLVVIHVGRVTLMPKDIDLAMKLSDATENYKTTISVRQVESEKDRNENEERRQKELEVLKNKRNQEKEDNVQSSECGSGIVTLFRPIISDDSLDTVSEEEVVITRGQKHQQVESSESKEEMLHTPRKNVRCSKKLTKEHFDFFEANGFTDELITIVGDEGWDKVDIENFVLMYNFQNGKNVALPIFDRDKTIYGKRGKEDGSTDKRPKCGKKSNKIKENKISKDEGTKNDGKAGKSGTGGKACSNKSQMSEKDGKDSKGKTSKKGETSKASKGGKLGTNGKTSSSEEETSRKKDRKGTKPTALKKEEKSKKSKAGESCSGGKKSSKMAKSRKEAKESEPGKSGKSASNKDVSSKEKVKGKKSRKDDMVEPIVHFGTNEVDDLYREGRGDPLDILSESDNGEVREVRERDGRGELEMVETNVQQVRNKNVEMVRSGDIDITGINENTRVDNLENVSGHGNVENEVLEGNLEGWNREESEHETNHRSVEIDDRSNREDVEMQDGSNTQEAEDGKNREEAEDGRNREEAQDGTNRKVAEVEEELPYKCKFCTHSFEVYDAYIIHVESRHPGWQDSDGDRYRQERLDSQFSAMMQEQEEQSDTVQVLDENDEVERQLVE